MVTLIIGVVTLIILLFVVSFVRHGRIGPAVIVIFTIMVTLAALFWSPSRTNDDSIELIPPGLQADDRDSRPIQRHLYGTTAPSSIPDSGLSSQPSTPEDGEQHDTAEPQGQKTSDTASNHPTSSPAPTLEPAN